MEKKRVSRGLRASIRIISLAVILLTGLFPFSSAQAYSLDVSVTDAPYNAAGDGVTNDRVAIQSAIDDVYNAGGGTVTIPRSHTFLTGNLVLKSNVTLNIDSNAVLKQSPNTIDYTYTPKYGHNSMAGVAWGHTWYENQPLIYAGEGTQNIKVTGLGIIEMTRGVDCDHTLHICPLGLYRVSNFEISNITIQDYSSYAIMPYSCDHGLFSNVTVRDYADTNTDGISMQNCQNMRVTGCHLTTGDDSLYVWTSYNDPRGQIWWSSSNPQPSKNIEIDHNVCNAGGCKGFAFISWGTSCPDLSLVEASNISIHDNTFNRMGIWNDDPYDSVTVSAPIKNIRFANNSISSIQDNFYTTPISDMNGYDCMTAMRNGNFENTGEAYWTLAKNSDPDSAGVNNNAAGQDGVWYGYIDKLAQGDAKIYQGLKLMAGISYQFTAKVQSSGVTCRMFVRNLDTQALVAEMDFNNTSWMTKTLNFSVPASANYQIGIERGTATSGWARIDTASVAASDVQNIFTTQTPVGFDNAARYELGTRFKANADGHITKVRIYTSATESGDHTVRIWRVSNSSVVAGPYTWTVTPGTAGWKEFTLPTALSIAANTDYIVSVSNSTDKIYARTQHGFDNPINNGSLITYTGSGVYSTTLGSMPTSVAYNSNYFRDVTFVSDEQKIMTTQTPAGFDDAARYELGTRFKTNTDGRITKVRIYTSATEGGDHTVRIWRVSDSFVVAGPYTWTVTPGTVGWKEFTLPSALSITANTDYIVSVSNSTDKIYARTQHGFDNPINNDSLMTYTGSGVYSTTLGSMPANVSYNSNYFRDIAFMPY